ncbi:hypothetical protein EYR40_004388 [Pleurotus pulmonarius]|nr:hypothetical protein EYR40_004388 [Pleurotus pulmonarius]KAF4607091.1 hypothetical protein EYR38_001149 [Pleurotus pulmonarius]
MAASPTLAIRAPGSPPSVKQEPLAVDTTPNFKISADSALNGSSADARAADNERPPTTASPSPTVQEPESKEPNTRGGSVADSNGAGKGDSFRDRQAKPNKVYIGGLPTNTRIEDLRSCFGKIGTIVQIELKIGYGFVEFDSTEAAEESVAKYNEGYFMGNKIRVEISHGGRATRTTAEAGTCFRCGDNGHWARECPNAPPPDPRDSHSRRSEPPLIDRIQRDYPPPRDHPSYRDDYGPSGRLPPPPRDSRYYDYPPSTRDYRRPVSPARDYRDYPPPPPSSRGRDYDDYRRAPPVHDRDRYPPPPPSDYRGSRYPPPTDSYRGYAAPPASYPYDRYERRSMDRYAGPPAPPLTPVGRPRTPPRHARDDYDRPPPPRDYPEYRGRPITPPPPRYPPDYARTDSDPLLVDAARRAPLLAERTNLHIHLALLEIHMLPAMGPLRALARETTHLLEAAKLIIDDPDPLDLFR